MDFQQSLSLSGKGKVTITKALTATTNTDKTFDKIGKGAAAMLARSSLSHSDWPLLLFPRAGVCARAIPLFIVARRRGAAAHSAAYGFSHLIPETPPLQMRHSEQMGLVSRASNEYSNNSNIEYFLLLKEYSMHGGSKT